MSTSSRITLACALSALVCLHAGPALAHPLDPQELANAGAKPKAGPESLQQLRLPAGLPPERFEVTVELDEASHVLLLERHSLRAPGFRVRAWLPDGRTVEHAAPRPATYRGRVLDAPSWAVVADLGAHGLNARIVTETSATWRVESVAGEDRSAGEATHRVRAEIGPPPSWEQDEHVGELGTRPANRSPVATSHAGQHLAEIALDLANSFYVGNGSTVPGAVAAMEAVLNQVDFVFAREVLITHSVTDVIVRTAPFYPGVSIYFEFVDEWNANQTHIQRDLAHLLADVGLSGVAAVGTVCDLTAAYGYSSGGPEPMGHEIVHNWGAVHCHDEPCNFVCNNCVNLAPKTNGVITDFREGISCLDEVGPYATSLPPYAARDISHFTRDEMASGSSRTLDVMANDHDGNLDTLSLDRFDASSRAGGTLALSPGTGAGGNDELIYTPPAAVFPGHDRFDYTLGDGGLQDEGTVELLVDAPLLIAYWPMDEGMGNLTADVSGGNRTVNMIGATWSTGLFGTAMNLTGGYATAPGLDHDMRSTTISAWLRRDGSQIAGAGVLKVVGPNTTAGLNFGVANELRYQWNDDSAASSWDSGLVVPDDQWVFVALVVEPDQATMYLHDGTLQSAVNPIAHAPQDFDGAIYFGWDPVDIFLRYSGLLEDLRVYNHALSSTQITALQRRGGRALGADPPDSGRMLPGTRQLTWVPGLRANSHRVYFGSDYAAVRDANQAAPEFQGNQALESFPAPPPLLPGVTYAWRIDEVTSLGVVRGDVWVFSDGSPIARWRLDETSGTTAADSVGGADGTLLGAPLLDEAPAQPELARSIRFDGVDDSVEIPPLNLNGNRVTITAWVRRDGAQSDAAGLFFTRAGGTIAGLNLTSTGELSYKWNDMDIILSFEFLETGLVVPDDTWVFVALVIAPDRAKVYLGDGGVLSSSVDFLESAREEFDGQLYLGQDPIGGRHFKGWLDDVRIYDHAMTESALGALFEAGIPAGRVPDGAGLAGSQLVLDRLPGGDVVLDWASSCLVSDSDYVVYEGEIGDFTTHVPAACTTSGTSAATLAPGTGSRYFIVVPTSGNREGSLGVDSTGAPRPDGATSCMTRFVEICN